MGLNIPLYCRSNHKSLILLLKDIQIQITTSLMIWRYIFIFESGYFKTASCFLAIPSIDVAWWNEGNPNIITKYMSLNEPFLFIRVYSQFFI